MPITILDGILIAIMLVSGLLAMVRGFSREVLSVASWIIAAVSAFLFYKQLSPHIAPYFTSVTTNKTVPDIAAAGIIFLVALLVVSLITMKIADFIVDSRIGALDRTLGFVFGALRGMLLMVVALLFLNWFIEPDKQPEWIANAKSKSMLDSIGNSIIAMVPEDPIEAGKKYFGGETTPEGAPDGAIEGGPDSEDANSETDAGQGAQAN